jgi:hypothetical protein
MEIAASHDQHSKVCMFWFFLYKNEKRKKKSIFLRTKKYSYNHAFNNLDFVLPFLSFGLTFLGFRRYLKAKSENKSF